MTELKVTQNGNDFCCLGVGENISVSGFCSIAIGDGTRSHGDFEINYREPITIDGDMDFYGKLLGILMEKAILYSYVFPPEKRSHAAWVIQKVIDLAVSRIRDLRSKTPPPVTTTTTSSTSST